MHGQVAQSKLWSLSKAPRSILDNLVAAHCEVLLCSGNGARLLAHLGLDKELQALGALSVNSGSPRLVARRLVSATNLK